MATCTECGNDGFAPDELFRVCCGNDLTGGCSCDPRGRLVCDYCWHELEARGAVSCASGCDSVHHGS